MILLKVGQKQLYFQKQDGTKKWFKATPEAIAYVGKTFKNGDSLKAEFNKETFIIEKVTGQQKEGYKGGGAGKSYNGGGSSNYTCSDERSVYAAVATMVAGMKLDLKGAKEAVIVLFAQGMELIKSKEAPAAKPELAKAKDPEEEPGVETTKVKDGEEEPDD